MGRGRLDCLRYIALINSVGETPGVSWLLSSDIYQNSVVRYHDLRQIADLESIDSGNIANIGIPEG